MKKRFSRTVEAEILTFGELSLEEAILLHYAQEARGNAQAPYSGYHVGAAVQSARTGKVYVGCNVERATYTQTSHAEQAAIDAMIAAEGPVKIAMLACVGGPAEKKIVYAYADKISEGEHPFCDLPAPCGHCLQIIWENCAGDPDVVLLSVTAEGEICYMTIGDAFPVRFGPQWFELEDETEAA